MPNYYLFHQNLRTYGGGVAERNSDYNDAMYTISSSFAKYRVPVAGFTEVMNARNSTVQRLGDMAYWLDEWLTAPLMFAVGITAFKSQSPEFVAISVSNAFKVEIKGRVLLSEQMYDKPPFKWKCFSGDEVAIGKMPDQIKPDSRGLAYVGGRFKGKKMIAGFMHNMYSLGDRSAAFQMLSQMIQLIWAKHSSYQGAGTFFGGDFNVDPRGIGGSTYTVYACDDQGRALKTTKRNTYDFWIASKKVTNDDAFLFVETRNVPQGLSDHGGIALRLPMDQL